MTSSSISTALYHFEQIRTRIAELVESMPRDRLFEIPEGFTNNIAWHAAHAVVTQQLLVYGLSDVDFAISQGLIERYRKGTTGVEATPESFDEAMEYLMLAPVDLRRRYAAGEFTTFREYQTSAGIDLASFEDAILFNNIHEGIHLGYMMGVRKAVGRGWEENNDRSHTTNGTE